MVSVVQDNRASFKVNPKYCLTIQKPAPLTWSQKTEPAPTAKTISAGSTLVDAIIGATRPAPVNEATVVDPKQIRSTAVINQAAISGEV